MRPVVKHWVSVSEFLAHLEYLFDILMIHDKHSVRSFLARFIAPLSHAAEIFSERRLPDLCRDWVVHQLLVT